MEYAKSPINGGGGGGGGGSELMDFSLIEGFSSPRFAHSSSNRANFVTLGPASASSAASAPFSSAKVPSIYPSLHLDDEFTHYEDLKVKPSTGVDENDMITSRDLSPGAFGESYVVKDGLMAQGPIELDSVKHKLSSFWNNVKYGKCIVSIATVPYTETVLRCGPVLDSVQLRLRTRPCLGL